jgi:phosphoglucosamine mutase
VESSGVLSGRCPLVRCQRGRILVRPSGTEPVVRVMVEAQDAALARDGAQALAAAIQAG